MAPNENDTNINVVLRILRTIISKTYTADSIGVRRLIMETAEK